MELYTTITLGDFARGMRQLSTRGLRVGNFASQYSY